MGIRQLIDKFLAETRVVMVGVSSDEKHFSRILMRDLISRDYEIVPVNPNQEEIDGIKVFSNIEDIPDCPRAMLFLVPAEKTMGICRQAPSAGIEMVWFYRSIGQGAYSQDAVEYCRKNDIEVIPGYCPYMFLPDPGFIHSAHVFLMKLAGKYPR